MNPPTFGLYPSAALLPAQRLAAGSVLALDTPRMQAGLVTFGRSFWLPLPPALASAQAVRLLGGSALSVRFEPRRFVVGSGRGDWFPEVERLDADTVRIGFAWPAEVVRVTSPPGGRARRISLFRADGDALASEPAMQGTTGFDLGEPWVGTPLVVRLGLTVVPLFTDEAIGAIGSVGSTLDLTSPIVPLARPANLPARRPAAPARAVKQGSGVIAIDVTAAVSAKAALAAALVPSLTLAGRPTSPRLKLFAEAAAGATLLWQAMLPGAQADVTLPAQAIADEWAAALEQARKLAADAVANDDDGVMPLRLRLDIESDAPCTATLAAPQLTLETETERLGEPQRLAFGGLRAEALPLVLGPVAWGSGDTLRVTGRVAADHAVAADAGSAAADGRTGVLLGEGVAALQPLDLPAPLSLAGVSLPWRPLSDTLVLRLRLLADDQGRPGARVLAQAEASVDTPVAGALALRWPAPDLQAQRVWVEAVAVAGTGIWLFAATGALGWIEDAKPAGTRRPLPSPLAATPIPAAMPGQAQRAIRVQAGTQTLAAALPEGPFELQLGAAAAAAGITFTGAVRGTVTIGSARAVRRSGG
jgi:hypothetical protein